MQVTVGNEYHNRHTQERFRVLHVGEDVVTVMSVDKPRRAAVNWGMSSFNRHHTSADVCTCPGCEMRRKEITA